MYSYLGVSIVLLSMFHLISPRLFPSSFTQKLRFTTNYNFIRSSVIRELCNEGISRIVLECLYNSLRFYFMESLSLKYISVVFDVVKGIFDKKLVLIDKINLFSNFDYYIIIVVKGHNCKSYYQAIL